VEPAAPEPFGKYQLIRRLAAGGMAEIYLAEHHGEAGFVRPVVIKRVLPTLTQNPEFTSMFLDEARLLARLSHPNVVHVYDFGRIEDTYFLALEYVRGGNLRELFSRLKGAPLPIAHALFIAGQALAGLDHAHRARAPDGTPLRLVHRDISPSNLLLSVDGAVKLADFGIARSTLQQVHTAAFVIKGKLSYMSPEQVSGRPLDARSDLFSMGTLLWEMVTGRRLFARDNPGDVQLAICVEPIPNAREYRGDVPSPVLDVLGRALQRERDQRFPSAAAMQTAIDQCLLDCRVIASAHHLASFVRDLFPEMTDERHQRHVDDNAPTMARFGEGGASGHRGTQVIEEPRPEKAPFPDRASIAPPANAAIPLAQTAAASQRTAMVRERAAAVAAASRGSGSGLRTQVPAPSLGRDNTTAPLWKRRRDRRAALAAEALGGEDIVASLPRAPRIDQLAGRPARRSRLLRPLPLTGAAVLGAVFTFLIYFAVRPEVTPVTVASTPTPSGVTATGTRPWAGPGADARATAPPEQPPQSDAGEPTMVLPPDPIDPSDPTPGREYGLLSVQSRPSAVVLVDGRRLGETPIYRRRVLAGSHALELRAVGLPPLRKRIYVPAHGEFQRTFDLAPRR
jgi:serine/threonine protein kinase